ncbi:uncharacterized protein CEXT_687011 [Caerostris extrusa]|uniref:Uncharacterized protein n=1 Tax=Caerostris extrusa TaxID=172846 RepID=A0AAV4MD65_CAEEX|nr:uncharacterized protein CEXT_687011 [Caerostris extrusa]
MWKRLTDNDTSEESVLGYKIAVFTVRKFVIGRGNIQFSSLFLCISTDAASVTVYDVEILDAAEDAAFCGTNKSRRRCSKGKDQPVWWEHEINIQRLLSTSITFWFHVIQPIIFYFHREHFVDFGTHLLFTICVFIPWTPSTAIQCKDGFNYQIFDYCGRKKVGFQFSSCLGHLQIMEMDIYR